MKRKTAFRTKIGMRTDYLSAMKAIPAVYEHTEGITKLTAGPLPLDEAVIEETGEALYSLGIDARETLAEWEVRKIKQFVMGFLKELGKKSTLENGIYTFL